MRRKKESEKISSVKSGRWFIKITSLILSVLVVFFMIPVVSYAEMIETAEELLSAKPEEAEEKISLSYTSEDPAYELVEMREERAKYFRMEDGTYVVASYEYPVHTMQDGEWVDVDNSLTDNGNEIFTSNARIKFAKKITGNGSLFTLHESNHKLTLSLIGAVKKTEGKIIASESEGEKEEKKTLGKLINLENITSRVIYEDILEGVDIEYVLESTNLKENIIVKEKSEDGYSYSFELSLNNLTARMTPEGDVQIVNERGVVVYTIPAPVVYDSNGEYADPSSAQQSLEYMGNGKCRLTVSVSEDWMNAEERVYPVTVDPTLSVADSSVIDLYVDSASNMGHYHNATYLKVNNTSNAYWKISDNYLPSLTSSAHITDAVIGFSAYGEADIGAYEISTNWSNYLCYEDTLDVIGDCDYYYGKGKISGNIVDYATVSMSYDQYKTERVEWNITEIAKLWFSGYNYGVGFKLIPGSDGSGAYLRSTEYNATPRINEYKPTFILRYVDTKGIEDYYSYSSQSAGLAGSSSINLATGNLTFAISTLTSSDYLMPVSPTLVYEGSVAGSSYVYGGKSKIAFSSQSGMAYGFKLNLSETVVKEHFINSKKETEDVYIYSDGDGTEHYFYQALDENGAPIANTYHDDSGLRLTLVDSSDGFTITSLDGTVKSFTKGTTCPYETAGAWYLSRITDRVGNAVEITLNSNYLPTSTKLIPNGSTAIETLRFIYNSSGKLAVIRNVASRDAVVLKNSDSYSSSSYTSGTKYLRKIIYARGSYSTTDEQWLTYANGGSVSEITSTASASYEYSSNYNTVRLTKAKDDLSGRYLKYNYSGDKIASVTEYGSYGGEGQSINIIYRNGYTEVTTSGTDDKISTTADNIITRYTFDRSARVISSYSTNYDRSEIYGATSGTYEEQDNVKNNIKESVAIGGSPVSYLLNGSFEINDLAYWVKTSKAYRSSTMLTGFYCATIETEEGTEQSITQSVFLPEGTYTLSMDYMPVVYDGPEMRLQAKGSTGTYYCNEELSLSDTEHTEFTTAAETFDVPNVTNGGDTVEICIKLNTPLDYTEYSFVKIDDVSLVEGTRAADVNLVNIGDFDGYGISSSGSSVPASTFWTGNYSLILDTEFGKVAKLISSGLSSSKTITQNIVEIAHPTGGDHTMAYNNTGNTYYVSAFGYANSAMQNESAFFGIKVKVYYKQQIGVDDAVVEYEFPFSGKGDHWQYVCGMVNCEVDDSIKAKNSDKYYNVVSKIEVICEYSGQINGSYALFDNLSFVKTAHTPTNRFKYDEYGNLIEYSNYSNSVYYEYTENNDLKKEVNNLGQITEYEYDENRNLVKEEKYNFTSLDGLSTVYPRPDISLRYDSEGNEILPDPNFDAEDYIIKTPRNYTIYEYNNYGLLTKTTTYEASSVMEDGEPVPKAESSPIITSTEYNLEASSKIFGSVFTETDSNNETTRYYYDNNGSLNAVINLATERGMSYTYDSLGRMIAATPVRCLGDPSGYIECEDTDPVNYTYGTNGNLSEINTPSTQYNFGYDQFGNNTYIDVGFENNVIEYEYNSNNGKLSKITYGNGCTEGCDFRFCEHRYTERYVYDHLDNVSEIWYTVGGVETKAYEYKYTQNGQLFSVTDLPNGIVSVYEYDRKGRMIGINVYSTEDYNYDLNTAVSYDRYDRITGYTDTVSMPSAFGTAIQKKVSVSYEYGSNGLLKKSEITGAGGMTHEYRYNKFDQLIKRTETSYGGFYREVEYEYEYTDERQSASRVEWFISSAGTESSHHEKAYWYTYGTDNNITRVFQSGWTVDYQYDDLNQLIREDNLYLNQTYTYTYDTAGNILEKKIYNYTTGALGTPIDTIVYVYGNGDWGDQLTSYDGHIITYDRVGNPLSYNNGSAYTFTWEGRRLKTAVKGTQSFTFSYNDEGIRTSKTVNGVEHNYILSGSRIVAEYWGSNLIVYVYDAEGSPIGMQYLDSSTSSSAWQTFWYEKNLQGDIVTVYSNDGTPLINYFYDAWGNHITRYQNSGASTKATLNPFRYRGYYYDEDLGLYYLNSRYYDSTVGRFISSDSSISNIGGDIRGYNMYSYCFNNPVNMTDPDGNWPQWATKLVAAVAVVAVVAAIAAVTVATAGAGTAVACVAVGAAKGAAIGLATGAVTGAAAGAVNHRLSTGSWEGADEAALNGMADGALSGAITGAITGGIKGGIKHLSTSGQLSASQVDPRVTKALKTLDESGIRPGQTQISQKKVLDIYNSYNAATASSSYTKINGVLYVSEGHHTMIANVMKYGRLNSGMNMGLIVNDTSVVTNVIWTTLKIFP